MIVEAVEQPRDGFPGSHIQFSSVEWCCDKMSGAWLGGRMVFGDANFSTINQNPQVCMMSPGAQIGERGSAIDYCPYCGQKIDVNVTKE